MAAGFSYEDVHTERMARAVIASVVPPAEFTTHMAFRASGGDGLATLRLGLTDERIPGVSPAKARVWRRRFDVEDPEEILAGIEMGNETGQRLIVPGDTLWPRALPGNDHRAPFALWARGDTEVLKLGLSHRVALVGTEVPSKYGVEAARRLAEWLTEDNRTLVAVPREGISNIAIETMLRDSGRVLLVVPHSIDRAQSGTAELQAEATKNGLILTAQSPYRDTHPAAENTSQKIAAALAGVTTIVESSRENFNLDNIAAYARGFDRAVGAVPGRITDTASVGTNDMIRDGQATLIADRADLSSLPDQHDQQLPAYVSRPPLTRQAVRDYGLSR